MSPKSHIVKEKAGSKGEDDNMREIKFRAWDGKEMVYSENPPAFSFWKYIDYDSGCLKTLMQYAGLKDKHGKEVYEGDKIRLQRCIGDSECEATVEFDGAMFRDSYWHEPIYIHRSLEVVGNIYEN